MDDNNDGCLTEEEFLNGCLQDGELAKMLAPNVWIERNENFTDFWQKIEKQQLIKTTNKQTTTTTRTTETGDTVGEAREADDCSKTSKNKCEMESYLNLFKLKEIL